MYKKIPGCTTEIVHGIEMYIPKRPPMHEIRGYDLPKKEQKWFRVGYPDWWDEIYEDEQEKREEDEDYRDPRLEAFREQEWKRRLNGFWFMNCGEPTYITGTHYLFLEWTKLDVGYPKYYDFARKNYYFTQYCIEDLFCLGYFKVGGRGFGKTMEEITVQLDIITKPPHRSKAAQQSKSGNDAYKVFKKTVEIYNEYPEFFKPDSNHGTNPEKKLSFFRDKVKGKKAKKVKQDDDKELKNELWWEVAKETALDGDTLVSVIQEEIGKSDPKEQVDVAKRIQVNRFCVYRNNIKRGIIQCTSTIEEMKAGGAEALKVWQGSDFNNKSENGFTTTGLYRAFTSALDTTVIDEYGRSDRDAALKIHEAERRLRKDDPNELSSYIRKNPFTPDEAFMVDSEKCVFNAMILNDRMSFLNVNPTVTTKGDFEWENGPDSNVKFVHNDKNGKFEVSWLIKDENERNKVKTKTRPDGSLVYSPLNDHKFCIGTDPISHSKTVDNRNSRAAAYVFRKFDMQEDGNKAEENYNSYQFIVEYLNRPLYPEIYFEDMIKIARYFGCQILIENQKNVIMAYFRQRGYEDFIMYRPEVTYTKDDDSQATEGAPASKPMIDTYTGRLQTFIIKHGHRLPFKELIKDLLVFEPGKTTKFDAAVAAGWTLLAREKIIMEEPKPVEITQLFKTYNNSGSSSTLAKV